MFLSTMKCTIPQPLSITLYNGSNVSRYGKVQDSTPEDCLPHSLVGQTVSATATNLGGTFKHPFTTAVTDDAAGEFKIDFDLSTSPMTVGTYGLQITVRDHAGNVLKTMTGALNIQGEPL